jgi:hypothetical protein
MVNLSGLKDINGNNLSPDPSLQTTAPFTPSTAGTVTSVKTTCPDILSQAKSLGVVSFLENYGINDKVSSTAQDISIKDKLTTFKTALSTADIKQTITNKLGYSTSGLATGVNDFITSLETTHLPVISLVNNCLKEDLQIDMTDYNAAKATAEESKTRLDSILTPEQHTSYYEGWFPIIRPMTESALFFVFGAALFIFLTAIVIFLSMSGVDIQIQIPELLISQFMSYMAYTFPPGFTYYIYSGLFAGVVGTYLAFRFKYI